MFLGVYDGHGGSHVSEFLKKNAHFFIFDHLLKSGDIFNPRGAVNLRMLEKVLERACDEIQYSIIRILKKNGAATCGSTANMIIIINKSLIICVNVGDSRSILVNNNVPNQFISLSEDHKPSLWREQKRIMELGGYVGLLGDNPNDVPRVLKTTTNPLMPLLSVSRSFGDLMNVPLITHKPDIQFVAYPKAATGQGNFSIILGTDGLWDVMMNREVSQVSREIYARTKQQTSIILQKYHEYATIEPTIRKTQLMQMYQPTKYELSKLYHYQLVKNLIQIAANDRKSGDNISVCVINL
jgi:serine/threonine protein phosphatase PrpC